MTLEISRSREIILGQVVACHLRPNVVDREKLYVDPFTLDAVGRIGGHGYARTRDYFDLPIMNVEQWRSFVALASSEADEGSSPRAA
jgi:hypothetical protein